VAVAAPDPEAPAADAADAPEEPMADDAPQLPDPDGDDPHQWLEEVLGDEALAQVTAWNEATLAEMEADPRFAKMKAQALEALTSDARLTTGEVRGKDLYNFWQSPEHVRGIWRRTPLKDWLAGAPDWEVLVDVDALAEAEGENWIWQLATCAPGSERCLVLLSRGGKDASVVREFDRATKSFVDDGFALPEAKSRVAFVDEDTVLVATDFGDDDSMSSAGYPRHVRRWHRGQSLDEAQLLVSAGPDDMSAGPFVVTHRKEQRDFLYTRRSFYEWDLYLLDDGEPRELPLPDRFGMRGLFDGQLILEMEEPWTHRGVDYPQGALVAYHLDDDTAELVLQPGEGQAVREVSVGKTSVMVAMLSDVVGELWRLRPGKGAWSAEQVPLPDNGQVSLAGGSDELDDVLVSYESLTKPVTLFHVDKKNRLSEVQALESFFDPSDIVVEQRFVESTDGTRVPYFLMARRDVLEGGPAPTIQYGYGGFQAAILPTYFREAARPQQGAFVGPLWVADGGVLVLSNIRGGGEYGPAWHEAALLHDRQKAYDDFFAIGEQLIADGVTTAEQLGAIGRSNGGLLMGVALTQRPDLYAAIDCGVPLLDMLRYHQLLAGASWMGEYGNPDVPEERETLRKLSPYHNLDPDADYPKVLFYTSTKDDRVHPGHARKMAAALASLGHDFYYWENIEGGHGGVANQEQAALRIALEFLYFKKELGLD